MELALYQIIVPLISFVFLCKAFSLYFSGRKTIRELLSWIFVWGAIAVIAVFPTVTDIVANYLGIKSNINAIVFISLGILFYAIFKLVVIVEDLEYQLTQAVRSQAIKDALPAHRPKRRKKR